MSRAEFMTRSFYSIMNEHYLLSSGKHFLLVGQGSALLTKSKTKLYYLWIYQSLLNIQRRLHYRACYRRLQTDSASFSLHLRLPT